MQASAPGKPCWWHAVALHDVCEALEGISPGSFWCGVESCRPSCLRFPRGNGVGVDLSAEGITADLKGTPMEVGAERGFIPPP